jgi:tetratricopeptide (TPR) repeat protein
VPSGPTERYDFFLSRRGSVAAVAQEVERVLAEEGYSVLTQDYDIPLASSFIEKMHEAVSNSRDLIILFTHDYLHSPYTRKEFTSFEAQRLRSLEERHIVVLRCDDAPLVGLLSDNVYQNLVGIADAEERKRRIIAAAEGHSQAESPAPRPFVGVPPRIPVFTGRTDELERLDDILMKDKLAALTQTVGRAAIQGLGGVGKTTLAIEYAYRFRGLYTGVWWCPAETRVGLLSRLADLAVTLGAANVEEADVEKAAKAALRRLAEQRATWFLIYDNVTSPDEIAELLPSAGARLLITSRFSDWGGWAQEVALDVLPLEEAVALLQSRAGRSDAPGARTLAEALGNLPLALDHAAAYCKRTQMHFTEYARKIEELISIAPRGSGYPRSVAATFDLAIAEAVARCAPAEALMAFLAQCAPERIPMTLVDGAVKNAGKRRRAVAALAEVSVVKHEPFEDGAPAVTVHRLIQAIARARSEANGTAKVAVERLIGRLAAIYPTNTQGMRSWLLCDQLSPHVLSLRNVNRIGARNVADWPSVLLRAGDYLLARQSYAEATQVFHNAVAICKKVLGPTHSLTGTCLFKLSLAFMYRSELDKALPLLERALAIKKSVFGPEHSETLSMAASYENLVALASFENALAKQWQVEERALAIFEKTFGSKHITTARSLLRLANMRLLENDHAGAQLLSARAFAAVGMTEETPAQREPIGTTIGQKPKPS